MAKDEAGRVVVGVRHSLGAYQALRYSVAQARQRDAALLVVHAVRRPAGRGGGPPDGAALDLVDSVFVEALGGRPTDLRIQIVVRQGPAGAALVAVAGQPDDLLVIGGSARRRWLRAAPVATHCASHAGCPVIIVAPPALARAGRVGRLARSAIRDIERNLSRSGGDGPRHVRPTFINTRWSRRR
jgi:nucleotide-binding universal stress UspA family protein